MIADDLGLNKGSHFLINEKKSSIFGSFSMHVFGISVGDDGGSEGETMWLEKLSCDI